MIFSLFESLIHCTVGEIREGRASWCGDSGSSFVVENLAKNVSAFHWYPSEALLFRVRLSHSLTR